MFGLYSKRSKVYLVIKYECAVTLYTLLLMLLKLIIFGENKWKGISYGRKKELCVTQAACFSRVHNA
ncbi:MAG: hypothetical protein FKGGLIKP_00666 [Sodalis sp. Fse]|nr:MAG: hypothetical protein FKGGLIKP_00666 [Sodalis sp. Fse]